MSSFLEQPLNLTLDSDIKSTEAMGYTEAKNADPETIRQESLEMNGLVAQIQSHFHRSKTYRRFDEERWLECYRNYRGIYGPDVQFTRTEKSKAFIKITKTKVLAAYAQVSDIVFGMNKIPISVQNTPVPENVHDVVHFDPKAPEEEAEEEKPIERTSTIARKDIIERVGPLKKTLTRIKDKLKEGAGLTPTALTYEPAKEAARELEKQMQDQLEEAGASKSLRATLFELCLFGGGVYKGPFAVNKEYPKWDETGTYAPVEKVIPDFAHVSIWDSYPDADARSQEEMEFFIQRHRMNRSQLRALKKRPMFREETIEQVIKDGANYQPEYWEYSLRDDHHNWVKNRWEVVEYWGTIDKETAELAGLEIPEEFDNLDEVQINCWICGDAILRLVLNPFTPARIPYQIVPYEINPYSIFGVGVAENMFDTQTLMNGFIRLAVDNAVLSSNLVFEVNETGLVPGQDMEIYPGKIFRTEGQLGQSINSIKFDNVTQECLMLFDKARQLADESTGMPSYAHGVSGIMSTGRTASGMSMLMGAAKENIKSVVRNIDDYLLVPIGKGLFAFNMQFNFDKKFIGDLEIVAKGTESVMRNEVRSQRLLQFYQMTSNPMDTPWIKRDYLLREIAHSLDLDPQMVVNDQREATIQADMLSKINQQMGVNPDKAAAQAEGGNPAGQPSPSDPTQNGGGNIAPGNSAGPGAAGFSGGGGGANGGSPQPQQEGIG